MKKTLTGNSLRTAGAKGFAYLLAALCLALEASASAGADQAQEAARLVEQTTQQLFARIKAQKSEIEADPSRSEALVDEVVSPHVDYERVSRWVLGPHWLSATSAQRERFIEEFRALLVRSYANAVVDYEGSPIEYLPMRAGIDSETVTVSMLVRRAQDPALRIDYRLHRTDGGWKLFDIVVGGTSLVVTHRVSFSEEIGSRGLDGLIRRLSERNAERG